MFASCYKNMQNLAINPLLYKLLNFMLAKCLVLSAYSWTNTTKSPLGYHVEMVWALFVSIQQYLFLTVAR
jgi:hypothetical protein